MNNSTGPKPAIHRDTLATKLEAICLAHLMLPFAILLIAVAGFAFGLGITPWVLPSAVVLAIVSVQMIHKSWSITIQALVIAIVTHTISFAMALTFFDGSYDGLSYHQEAVLRLAEGWNPWFENAEKYGVLSHLKLVEYFPKGSWFAGASVFVITNKIEAGKLFGVTLMIAAGCQVAASLLRFTQLRIFTVALLSFLAAFHPVAIYQSTTFLVDGLLASLLTIMVASFSVFMNRPHFSVLPTALIATAFAINIKFTGLVYAVILLGLILVFLWSRYGHVLTIKAGLIFALTGIVSVFFLGYAPYFRNFLYHKNLFHPVRGEAKAEFDKPLLMNIPANILDRNRFVRYVIANFSRTENPYGKMTTRLKFPFSVSISEAKAFQAADMRAGGFGPLFGALLLGSVALAIVLLMDKSSRRPFSLIWFWIAALLISVFAHDQGWWARYTPQSWLLPLLVILAALLTSQRVIQFIGKVMLAFALANVIFIAGSFFYKQRNYAIDVERELYRMKVARQPVQVYLTPFFSLRQRLTEAGIKFVVLKKLEPETPSSPPRHRIPAPGKEFWQEQQK